MTTFFLSASRLVAQTFEKSQFEKPAKEALLKYPELQNVKLKFVSVEKSKLAHQALPYTFSIFRSRKNRKYKIIIASDQCGELDSTLFKNLDYKSQVGVLAHELAHILDYVNSSGIRIITKGISYKLSKKFRKSYERKTNIEAMRRGFTQEILSWSNEVYTYLDRDGRGDYYHSPLEIRQIISQSGL